MINELEELKKKFINKESSMKLQLNRLSRVEQEVNKVKKDNKKLKIKLK